MQSLNEIKNKKILLVVAHPDDETLWFYQSLINLKQFNLVEILCLTYSSISKRGKELLQLGKIIDIKIHFGHCDDFGMERLLKNIDFGLHKVILKQEFDLIITHPPHGGEKPHPHHIQIYLAIKKACKDNNKHFGFFSEQKILEFYSENNYKFSFKKRRYISARVSKSKKLLTKEFFLKKWKFWYLITKAVWLDFNLYECFETEVNLIEKQKALGLFTSQINFLKEYNAYYKKVEYLFLTYKPPNKLESFIPISYDSVAGSVFKS